MDTLTLASPQLALLDVQATVEPVFSGAAATPDWRGHAVNAALHAEIYEGDGTNELLRRIRVARPDLATFILSVNREQLFKAIRRRTNIVREMMPATLSYSEYDEDTDHCVGWYEIEWCGHTIELALAPAAYDKTTIVCLCEDAAVLRQFVHTMNDAASQPVGRCLRYDGGWASARDIDAELGKVTWDDIVLPAEQMKEIRDSVGAFFAHKEVYRSMGFSWRRGLLLVGPPGTGKTMICKAVAASQPTLPLLYIRDVQDRRGVDAIKAIFTRARKLAPCILAFEDIDGMVGDERRTVFLNELDGFKDNDGLFVIASSNHPAKIDEALLKRPSRFDRVFHIGLPAEAERREFCLRVLDREVFAGRASDGFDAAALADKAAASSDGFTPAYLKEAFVSAALARAQEGDASLGESYAGEVLRQINLLGDYIRRAKNPDAWSEMRSARDAVGFRS